MNLLLDLLEEYRGALYTDNHDRIRRLGKYIRDYMKEVEK